MNKKQKEILEDVKNSIMWLPELLKKEISETIHSVLYINCNLIRLKLEALELEDER